MKLFASILLISTVPAWAQNVSPTIAGSPTREFGQLTLPGYTASLTTAAPNLVEGREFNQPVSIAFDTSTSPPIMYVADLTNNRVLAWKNPAALTAGNTADLVIGQPNLVSTLPQGCGNCLYTVGLNTPTAVAVDKSGNLYVIDAGNNRILRFPKPFQEQVSPLQPDLVIGQKTVQSGNSANQANTKPSDFTLYFAANTVAYLSGLAFDPQGNLWVTDSGNNRVLRYPASKLAASTVPQNLQADLVIGQTNFTTGDAPTGPGFAQTNLSQFYQPNSLAFDSQGRLYVADSLARVLYFSNPVSGAFADRILGIAPPPTQTNPTVIYPNNYTLGAVTSGGSLTASPRGLFTSGTTLFVCDTPQNRVVRYDPPETWAASTAAVPSPQIAAVYGQNDFVTGLPDRGLKIPATSGYEQPVAGAFLNGDMWIVDNKNNRVLSFPSTGTFGFVNASRVVGQDLFDVGAPDLIDGRGLYVYASAYHSGSMVVDKTSTPNHLYVADPNNHRILAFKDIRTVGVDMRTVLTTPADLVIGQPDLLHSTINYPNGDIDVPSATGLAFPSGVALDANGNLWVTDSGNGRVLRFPSPFNQPAGLATANLVLGQSSFTQKVTDPTANTMRLPIGIAQFFNGGLAVSDGALNRILLFRKSGTDFVTGQAASVVLGQTGFNAVGVGTSLSSLNTPRGLAVDTGDRLYVADSGNNRILIYPNTGTIANGATASSTSIGGGVLSQPESVIVSTGTGLNGDTGTGEIWIADSGNNRILRFPQFSTLAAAGGNVTVSQQPIQLTVPPLGIALDSFDNLLAVDGGNRVSFYFAQGYYQHAASFAYGLTNLGPRISPGEFTIVKRLGKDFQFASNPAVDVLQTIPYPKSAADIQVLVDGVPAPVYDVSNTVASVYFLVPNNTQSSGYSEIIVKTVSTNQILAADYVQMVAAAPGLFTTNQGGTGQIAALNHNQDGSYAPQASLYNGPLNAATNSSPVLHGAIIEMYLTGMGHIDNAPPDGVAPDGAQYVTSQTPFVTIGGLTATVTFSGLAPGFPGLWQINAIVPANTLPNDHVAVTVQLQDQASIIGGVPGVSNIGSDRPLQVGANTVPANAALNGLITTIAVK